MKPAAKAPLLLYLSLKHGCGCASGLQSYHWIWVGLFSFKNQCCWKKKKKFRFVFSCWCQSISLSEDQNAHWLSDSLLEAWCLFVLCKHTFDCMLCKLCLSFIKYVFFIKKIKSSDEIRIISYVIRGGMKCLCFYLEKIGR